MFSFELDFPDVAFSGKDKDGYNRLKSDDNSPFKDYDMAEIFIFVMSYGFFNKKKRLRLENPQRNMPQSAFKLEMRNLMRAIAIADQQNLDVIKDHSVVVKICEEYANAAFPEVFDKIIKRHIDTKAEDVLDTFIRQAELSRSK